VKKLLGVAATVAALSGCSMFGGAMEAQQRAAMDVVVDSSERVLCRDIPVGTWMRRYGSNTERREAWRLLCAPPSAIPMVVELP